MTTAMDNWGEQGHAHAVPDHEHGSLEEELTGGLAGGSDIEPEAEHEGEAAAEAEGAPAADAALAAKKAKDKKIMMVGGGVVGALILGVVGLKLTSGGAPAQQQVQQYQQQVQQQYQPQGMAPVEAPQALAPIPAGPVVPAPVEAAAPVPGNQPVAPASLSSPVAPVAMTAPSPAAIPTPAPARVVAPAPEVAALRSDVDALRADIETMRGQLAAKDKAIAELRSKPTPAPAKVAAAVASKPVKVAKEEVIITERAPRDHDATVNKARAQVAAAIEDQRPAAVVDPQVVAQTRQTSALPPPAAKNGKVRGEFSVYAISNGRAWVTWSKDGNNYAIGPNSELPDYSKVTSIDDVKGVVFTSSGEIHPKPPTK